MLCQLYARTGQYGRFLTTYREWSYALPNSPEVLREKENDEKFSGRPVARMLPQHTMPVAGVPTNTYSAHTSSEQPGEARTPTGKGDTLWRALLGRGVGYDQNV
jgi:hypothetical protein